MDLVNWTIGTDYMCSDNTVKNVVVNATASSLSGRHYKGMLKVTISLHIEVIRWGRFVEIPKYCTKAPSAVRLAREASLSVHGAPYTVNINLHDYGL